MILRRLLVAEQIPLRAGTKRRKAPNPVKGWGQNNKEALIALFYRLGRSGKVARG